LRFWGIVLGLLTLVIAGGVAAGLVFMGGNDGDVPAAVIAGRSLELHATRPVTVDKVAFVDRNGQHRVIRPRASNRQLALVEVTIVNRSSLVTPLLVDPKAAQLGDRRGERIDALDPIEDSTVVDSADPEEGKYVPFLWGDVTLDKNTQIKGWMVFDVPKGLVLGTLWWDEVDSMVADFIEYRRRSA
jgi:hypothetical protein